MKSKANVFIKLPKSASNHLSTGGRNLLVLGVISIVITLITCGLSLHLYHESGDIYLDRSRPGFLPEKTENTGTQEEQFTVDENGNVTSDFLKDYLEHLQKELDNLDHIENPFSAEPLTNTSLGIPEK